MFARRAREYIVAYLALAKYRASREAAKTDGSDVNLEDEPVMSAHLIEKCVKAYKSHRTMVGQDNRYITKIVDIMKLIF